jgi:hypothetical protein
LSRRSVLKYGASFCIGAMAGPWIWSGLQPEAPAEPKPLQGFGRMQHEALLRRLHQLRADRSERQDRIESAADVLGLQRRLRERIDRCFGPWPSRGPVHARVLAVREEAGYRAESIRFRSRSGLEISADLYLPKVTIPSAAVLCTCGHAEAGKDFGPYKALAVSLVRRGFVTLLYDPIGQGARIQFPADQGGSRLGSPTAEHLMVAKAQALVGENFATWCVADAMSALDVLEEHPAVDRTHIGVTGNSGGGTIATWLAALDGRVTMVAPSCSVGSFVTNAENELAVDPEQCPPDALSLGLDHGDFLTVFAPRPTVILATDGDFFDVRATRRVVQRLERIHGLLESEDSVAIHVDRGPHGLTDLNREAIVDEFARLAGLEPPPAAPPEIAPPTAPSPARPVAGPTVPELTGTAARDLARSRTPLDAAQLAEALRDLAAIPTRVRHMNSRILRGLEDRGYPRPHVSRYAVETEPGILSIVYALDDGPANAGPPELSGPVVIYVAHHSADEELRNNSWVRGIIQQRPEVPALTVDLRGIGESRPTTGGNLPFDAEYGSDYFYASYGMMLGEPMAGRRTFDLLAVIDWALRSGATSIDLVARGWGTVPATFASLLEPRVNSLALSEPLGSYEEVATSGESVWPLSVMVPGALTRFDLPEIRSALGDRLVEVRLACGPMDRPV